MVPGIAAWLSAVAAVAISFSLPPAPPPGSWPVAANCHSMEKFIDCVPVAPNGRKVFLSVACHDWGTGECHENAGCEDFGENANSLVIAEQTTWGTQGGVKNERNLLERGYAVRIGLGTAPQNVVSSNAFLQDTTRALHIALHSNATGFDPCLPDSWLSDKAGTKLLYAQDGGRQAGEAILRSLGPASPGPIDEILERLDISELNLTAAPSAYIEAEFHTWSPGVSWLNDAPKWTWRIGAGVDDCFGTPRAGEAPAATRLCSWAAAT